MDLVVPARLPAQRETGAAHRARGLLRIVVRRDSRASTSSWRTRRQVLVNELNTIPGFTDTSVFARLFEASGVSYEDLLDRLLGYAIERHDASARTLLLAAASRDL